MDSTKCQRTTICNNDTPRIVRPWEISPKKYNVHVNDKENSSCTSRVQQTDNKESKERSRVELTPKASRKHLHPKAISMMERWYRDNFCHPYPTEEDVNNFVMHGNITPTQVRKWMANKRVRSNNTLSYNGTIHPKRLRRLQKQSTFGNSANHTTFSPKKLSFQFSMPFQFHHNVLFPVAFHQFQL